ncbi:chemotaxis protein [Zhengella mangrovi]|uniref:Chemotaxis protein methyltransferase n=1 Tax=Zhengella mangrovi TaxID=1982044 RepID=A0A2G1QJR0_9HYPH|nr:protein-glutamate O-methyltransferase [Zhengella mangrovi]PHP65694.1 chemotaxis protein [Zhengella mangrovi]
MEALLRTTAEGLPLDTVLSDKAFRTVQALVHERIGINLTDAKRDLVRTRLIKRLRVLQCSGFDEYLDYVADPANAGELQQLMMAITTNVTDFNREPHHFRHFRDHVVPVLRQRVAERQPVRIWSAGCSDGREPYTLGAVILDAIPDAARRDIRILATDIDANMLDRGRSGRYSAENAGKLPQELASRWFERTADGVEAGQDLRTLVAFRELNLIGEWPMRRPFEAIFCRNVLIYFARDLQAKLLQRFSERLKPGAHLYIGHSERMHGPAASRFEQTDITTYRFLPSTGSVQ